MATIIELRPPGHEKQKIDLNGLPPLRPTFLKRQKTGLGDFSFVAFVLFFMALGAVIILPFIVAYKLFSDFKWLCKIIRYRVLIGKKTMP